MRQLHGSQSDTTGLDPQHAAVEIGASVCATHRILLRAATVLAIRPLRPFAAIAHILDQGHSAAGAGLLAQLAKIGVDEAIATANGLCSHGDARRTRSRTVPSGGAAGPIPSTHLRLLLFRLLSQQRLQSGCRSSGSLHQGGGQLRLGILAVVDQQRVRSSVGTPVTNDGRLRRQPNNLDGRVCDGACEDIKFLEKCNTKYFLRLQSSWERS